MLSVRGATCLGVRRHVAALDWRDMSHREEIRVLRGGSWNGHFFSLRVSTLDYIHPSFSHESGGFRPVQPTSP